MTFKQLNPIPLRSPHPNGTSVEAKLAFYIDVWQDIKRRLENGDKVYVGYTSGDRTGSIAYIKKLDTDGYGSGAMHIPEKARRSHGWSSSGDEWRYDAHIAVVLGWEDRRNQAKQYISSTSDMVYFPDYEGPTVWEKFDKKAAEKAALEETKVLDCENYQLEVGDKVVYINTRYGHGARLDRGTIIDIKIKVNVGYRSTETYKTVNVIIQKDGSDQQSKITKPEQSIKWVR